MVIQVKFNQQKFSKSVKYLLQFIGAAIHIVGMLTVLAGAQEQVGSVIVTGTLFMAVSFSPIALLGKKIGGVGIGILIVSLGSIWMFSDLVTHTSLWIMAVPIGGTLIGIIACRMGW